MVSCFYLIVVILCYSTFHCGGDSLIVQNLFTKWTVPLSYNLITSSAIP